MDADRHITLGLTWCPGVADRQSTGDSCCFHDAPTWDWTPSDAEIVAAATELLELR